MGRDKIKVIVGDSPPTDLQCQSFDVITSVKTSMLVQRTGSGKTLAFLSPLTLYATSGLLKFLIVSPTKELAHQTSKISQVLFGDIGNCIAITGGGRISVEEEQLIDSKTIAISCTVGRYLSYIKSTNDSSSEEVRTKIKKRLIEQIQYVVLDEFDKLSEPDSFKGLEYIVRAHDLNLAKKILVSATANVDEKQLKKLSIDSMKSLTVVNGIENTGTSDVRIEKFYSVIDTSECRKEHLWAVLEHYSDVESICVFFNRKKDIDDFHQFYQTSRKVIKCHASMRHRFRSPENIKGNYILLASNVLARGIDFKHLQLIIFFDNHCSDDDYTHRIGRTARFSETGKIHRICEVCGEGRKIPIHHFPKLRALFKLGYKTQTKTKARLQEKRTQQFSKLSSKLGLDLDY